MSRTDPSRLEVRLPEQQSRTLNLVDGSNKSSDLYNLLLGPLFRSLPNSESAKPDIFGSAVIWAADSQQEVLDILKQDVYVQQGVWDFEKAGSCPRNQSNRACC